MSDAQQQERAAAPVFYANGVAFTVQLYDFKIDFALTSGPGTPPVVVASVHLSPQLAKVVGRMLRMNVKAYEQQTGQPIHLPDSLLKQLTIDGLDE